MSEPAAGGQAEVLVVAYNEADKSLGIQVPPGWSPGKAIELLLMAASHCAASLQQSHDALATNEQRRKEVKIYAASEMPH
jgi:hypothetical protein